MDTWTQESEAVFSTYVDHLVNVIGHADRADPLRTTDMVGLIDAQFNRRVTTTENGKPSRITVFEAIYKQLWTKEMGGDPKALKVRLMYDAFARKQQPEQKRQIIVEGGLQDRLWKRDALPKIENDDDV